MAFVVTSLGLLFTDPALGAALIQRPAIDERDRSTVFWTAAGIGALLTVLGIACSGLVADFFGEEQVQELFAVSSLCFVVVSLSVAHRALLARKLAYRSLEIREMVSIVAGGVVAVGVALAGFGPWAVILNFVTSTLVSTVLLWLLLDWRPRATFSRESARNLGGFSGRIFSASVLSWGDQNVDKALIGRFVGAEALGPYSHCIRGHAPAAVDAGPPVEPSALSGVLEDPTRDRTPGASMAAKQACLGRRRRSGNGRAHGRSARLRARGVRRSVGRRDPSAAAAVHRGGCGIAGEPPLGRALGPRRGVDPGPPHVRVVDRQVGGGRDWSTVGDRRRCGIVCRGPVVLGRAVDVVHDTRRLVRFLAGAARGHRDTSGRDRRGSSGRRGARSSFSRRAHPEPPG